MTRARKSAFLALVAALASFLSGCGREVDPAPVPGNVTEAALIMRRSALGPIVVVFTASPLDKNAPPDGVRAAAMSAIGGMSCSAAAFHWSEKSMAERWIKEQMEVRRHQGTPLRIVLAGHSLGATAAAETARDIAAEQPDAVIPLLITVDAIKTGRIGSTAGVTGAFIAGSLPGVKTSLTAYDSAPAPDGVRLLRHVNYYQKKTDLYHGTAMPSAENHLLSDSSGLLNHGNVDDFAYPMLVGDFRAAIAGGGM